MDGNIRQETLQNKHYRHVLITTKQQQLVLMSLLPKEDIPFETHYDATQFIRIERGKAMVQLGRRKVHLQAGDFVVIPPNCRHVVKNEGKGLLQLYTLYAPPQHKEGLVQSRQ